MLTSIKKEENSFRPLTGKLVLISTSTVALMSLPSNMFPSPYGEVGFDHNKGNKGTRKSFKRFPSPYGEVGFDRVFLCFDPSATHWEFPSPYGEVGFDLLEGRITSREARDVVFPSPYGEVGFDRVGRTGIHS